MPSFTMDRTGIGIVCFCLSVATLVANGQTNVNVALDKTYSQSSKSSPWLVDSNQAANGDTDGGYSTNCIETNDTGDLYPWWQVNLGRKYPVKDITVWARTNQQRLLYPFTITVDGQTCTSETTYSSRKNELTCPAVMYGQTVRLTRQGNDQEATADRILTVCEIQVWVPSEVSQCAVGWHGTSCDLYCNNNCEKGPGKNACYQSDGYCYDGCVNGWYGDQCSTACPTGCKTNVCQRSGQCSPCKTGYKGNTCSECEIIYYKTNAGTCNMCSSNCQSSSCDGPTGKCNGCLDGRHGDVCASLCSSNCKRCDQDTAVCTECAVDNFMLPACTECNDGYFKIHNSQCVQCSVNCLSGSCDKRSGTCNGCVAGYYESQCATPCSTGCLYNVCQQSGQCSPCKPGYTGNSCSECQDGYYITNTGTCNRCSSNCQSRSCNKQTGRCNECIDGRYGAMCGMSCPTANCQRCDQDTGVCTQCTPNTHLLPPDCRECQDRYYKSNTGTCVGCSNNCQSQSCDRQTGTCNGCVEGRFGDVCKKLCLTTCEGCDQATGKICTVCTPNSFRQPPACAECLDGYHEHSNNTECKNCTWSCKSGTVCDKITGHCPLCPPGQQGHFCDQAIEDDDTNTAVIAGAVVVAVVVILLVIFVIIFVMRRRRNAAKSRPQESEMHTTAQNGGEREERTGTTPLSFAPVIANDDGKAAKPKVRAKPAHKPAVKAKPTRAEGNKPAVKVKPTRAAGNIYENVSLPQQNSASNSTSTAPDQSTQQNRTGNHKQKTLSEPPSDDLEPDTLWSGEEPIYSNDPSYTNSIRVDNLQKAIVDSLQDGKVAEEFRFMVGQKEYSLTNGSRQENYYKNRFNKILPYDRNRVVLEQIDGDDASDYINASFIKGYKAEKAYIAAQGPKQNTVDDFWRMVWQEGVTDIVMLTNLKEGNKPKCHEYWPAKGKSLNTGHVEVTGLEEEKRADFAIRTFSVGQVQSKEKRRVRQYHYEKWMDHEVPVTTHLVNFWRYVRTRAPRTATAPPLVVHCSAGVGRTGTYIALDILIDQIRKEEEVSLYQTVSNLRNYRCHMVQNKGQYEFLHEAVVEAYMSGHSRLDTSAFDRVFANNIQHQHPHPRVDAEFEKLCQMRTCLTHPSHTVANLDENRLKNRNPNALPDDKHLVYITEHAKGRNQYINAVYMSTFLCSRGSIMTQLSLSDTVIDLWRLVGSWDVSTIVSIGRVDGQKGMRRYWPKAKEQPIKSGAYTISLKSIDTLGEHVGNYTVELTKMGASREIRVLHYEAWTGKVADNVSDLILLLDTLHASQEESTKEPIIIQCIDGVASSGVLCALWDVISRMTYDGEVDVYLAARHVHTVCPEAISSVVQYRFLYEMVQHYRASQSIYGNA